eukprot:10540577-Karenia_brevis.AAC.1
MEVLGFGSCRLMWYSEPKRFSTSSSKHCQESDSQDATRGFSPLENLNVSKFGGSAMCSLSRLKCQVGG